MSLQAINLVLVACLIPVVAAGHLAARKLLRQRVARLEEDGADLYFETLRNSMIGWDDPYPFLEHELEKQYQLPLRRLDRVFVVVNVATTVFVLVPLGFALYNFLSNHQQHALQFTVIGIVTLVVTKGGVLLLSLVIKPAIMGASGYAGQRIAKKVRKERKKRKRQQR